MFWAIRNYHLDKAEWKSENFREFLFFDNYKWMENKEKKYLIVILLKSGWNWHHLTF